MVAEHLSTPACFPVLLDEQEHYIFSLPDQPYSLTILSFAYIITASTPDVACEVLLLSGNTTVILSSHCCVPRAPSKSPQMQKIAAYNIIAALYA